MACSPVLNPLHPLIPHPVNSHCHSHLYPPRLSRNPTSHLNTFLFATILIPTSRLKAKLAQAEQPSSYYSPIPLLPYHPLFRGTNSPSVSSIQPTNHVSRRAKPAFPMSGLCHNTRAPDMSSLPTNMDILGWRLDWLAVQFGVGIEDFANEEVEEEGAVSKAVFPVVKSAG